MDAGTYEVLQRRMEEAAKELTRRAEALNDRRTETFGGSRLAPAGAPRLTADRARAVRDLVQVGGLLLAAGDPAPGAAAGADGEVRVEDVFALHRRHRDGFEPAGPDAVPGLLDDPRFRQDFGELYRYYRDARLLRLRRTDTLLLAVFRVGEGVGDVRVLRWRAPDGGGAVQYLDARGERDAVAPPAHDVEWTTAGRDAQVPGRHPHVSVDGVVFVSTEGGALTLKTENDTGTRDGVFSEPVEDPLQSLADAEVAWARVGPLVLLRVLPYNETRHRYLVHNRRTGEVVRLDGVGQGCRRLPDDQGVLFPGGCHLANAPAAQATRTFEVPAAEWEFDQAVHAPNGEDVLYVFHDRAEGRALLLPYNRVRQETAAPVLGRAWALFGDGALAVLRSTPGTAASRRHPVQLWDTPFADEQHEVAAPPETGGPLARIGNAELVRCVADCLAAARMAGELAFGAEVFASTAASCARTADRYPWLDGEGLGALHEPLAELREAAERIVEEHAREEEARARTAAELDAAEGEVTGLLRRARGETPAGAGEWVTLLTGLRRARGDVEALYELRHTDSGRVEALERELAGALEAAGRRAVGHLARPEAFADVLADVARLEAEAAEADSATAAEAPAGHLAEHTARLREVTEVFEGLDVADATVRTALLSRFGEVTAALNRARAVADGRRRTLLEREGRAEFDAELALLGQAVSGALATAGTPDACDEQLGTVLVRIEGLATRFGDLEERAERLDAQRTEAEEAFAARKQALVDERARRADRLAASAERGLTTVVRRAAALPSPDDVRAYFAADPMTVRVRATIDELRAAGDPVRATEFEGRLQAARQEAGRALRDRAELGDVPGTLRLGRHRFAVHDQAVALTLSPREGRLELAVTGTDYREPVPADALAGTEEFWDQPLASESPAVYRAEHLAAAVLADDPALATTEETEPERLLERLLDRVRAAAEAAHDGGYDAGVHDRDAARILHAVLPLRRTSGLLRFTPDTRAAAQLFWSFGTDRDRRDAWTARARSLARARATFGAVSGAVEEFATELGGAVAAFLPGEGRPGTGAYLFEELAAPEGPRFVTGSAARDLLAGFREALGGPDSPAVKEYAEELRAVSGDLAARRQLVGAWLGAFTEARGADRAALAEATAIEVCGAGTARREARTPRPVTVTGLLGSHPRVRDGALPLRLDEFLARTEEFRTLRVPAHRAYRRRRDAVLAAARDRLRLDRFRPRVQSGFVRNRLIDEVYLPLVGDSLARQIGVSGEERHTAGQGMLLLLSPPGYGKTTLMEYVAARLGMLFVPVDGPALGHRTTSLDPAAAPDAAARRELEKIDLALRLGDNVLLHLDDIQHTSPELLQKFIPLCDAQRRIDGADRGYDLRGKRFAVCMAGNPFTESGSRFRIPDMLANRADVWNLGDVLDGREDLFALSHVENALTSHPVLAPLAARGRDDLEVLLRMAEDGHTADADRLAYPYAPDERERIVAVLRNLLQVRDTVLRVNAAYIASAGQDDATRTEPPFLLQGSYRDTNRLAGRLSGVMNAAEVERLLDDHYAAEAQALASGAEAALLKLAELRGRLSPAQQARWAGLRQRFGTPPGGPAGG